MPQVDLADYAELFAFLNDRGVLISFQHFPAKLFKLAQCVNELRASRNPAQYRKPLLVALDMTILDGNHRWAGYFSDSPDVLVPCFRLNVGFQEAFDHVQAFGKTYRFKDGPQPYRL